MKTKYHLIYLFIILVLIFAIVVLSICKYENVYNKGYNDCKKTTDIIIEPEKSSWITTDTIKWKDVEMDVSDYFSINVPVDNPYGIISDAMLNRAIESYFDMYWFTTKTPEPDFYVRFGDEIFTTIKPQSK
jgi:hypothetical protein